MKNSVRCDAIKNWSRDPKQMLIAELTRQDREEASKIDIIAGRPVDQRIGASDQYIILDSSQRDMSRSDPSKGVFGFNIVSGGTTGTGMIGVVNQLNDIIEIEMQSFPFPNIAEYILPVNPISTNSLPVLITVPAAPAPVLNQLFNNRFIIQIEETSVQSFSDVNGVRHNFAFDLYAQNGQMYANPVSPVYVFTDPITRFDTITLIFRNPPANLEFGEDTMKGARLAILQNLVLSSATPVSIVIHNKLSDYAPYTYTHGAGTIVMTVPIADTIFINPNASANTFTFKNGVNSTNMTTDTRFLIDNVEGDGANEANGVYVLTTLVDNGATHTYTFTRPSDLDEVAELVQYVSVNVILGAYKGKIYFLDSSISALTEEQDWKDFGTTYLLSLYYPENKLIVGDRLKIRDLKQGTIPQKLYNHLTRPEGLYVGTVSAVVSPKDTPPIDDLRNYFRLNPDVGMGEFIYNSFTNNYTIKNIPEAKLYGFDTLKTGQIIIVPKSITKGISQLAETITYDKAVDTTTPGSYIYSNWTNPPDSALYGQSTLIGGVEYKTFTDKFNTAAVLDKTIDAHDLRYFELEYTGTEDALTDIYLGIIKPFTTTDFVTTLILTHPTWTTPGGNSFGNASIVDGSYTTTEVSFNTAAMVTKSIFDGAFIVLEYTNVLAQVMTGGFGITDEATYEALTGIGADWALDYTDISDHENLLFRLEDSITFKSSIDGAAIVTDSISAVATMEQGGKITIAVGTINATTINIAVKYIQDDGTVLFSKVFSITVVAAAAWYAVPKRFYITSNLATLTFKSIYSQTFPAGLPTTFISTDLQTNTHLSRQWFTPLNYKFGDGGVNKDGVYSTKSSYYDTPVILDVPIVDGNYTIFKYTGTVTQMLNLYVGVVNRDSYQSLVIDSGLPKSVYDNWSIQQKVTTNEGFLINIYPDKNHQVSLSLINKTPIGLPAGYQNSYANLVDGVYSTTSNGYNTAAVMYTTYELVSKYSFKYLGNVGTPSAYFGFINKATFTSALNAHSPLYLTDKVGWDTPTGLQYGNAKITSDGYYMKDVIGGDLANTAAIVENATTADIIFSGTSFMPFLILGYVDKNAYEHISTDPTPLIVPFILTKYVWDLPTPAFDALYKSSPTTGGIYKTNVSKYASAAMVNRSISESLTIFQYMGTTARHFKAVFGFISRDSYQALPVGAGENWGNSLEMTDNEGVLIEILQPGDPRNTSTSSLANQLYVKFDNATTTNYTLNIGTEPSGDPTTLPKIGTLGAIELGYTIIDSTTIRIYMQVYQSNGDRLFGSHQLSSQIDLTVADSSIWAQATGGLDPDYKRAYMSVNNKGEKYASNPLMTLPNYWAMGRQATFNDGILFEFIHHTSATNPLGGNTAIRWTVNGKTKTHDAGSALPSLVTGGKFVLSYVITDATTITVTLTLVQNGGAQLWTTGFVINHITDSALWINNKNIYMTNYNSTQTWKVANPTNWAKTQALTANNGALFRILSPTDPSNPHGPNSALAKIFNNTAEAYIDLSSDIGNVDPKSFLTTIVNDVSATEKRIRIVLAEPDGTVTFLQENVATITIADAGDFADWKNTVVPYITTNDPTESYESNISLNTTLLYNNNLTKEPSMSPYVVPSIPLNGLIALYVETKTAGEINLQLEFLDPTGITRYYSIFRTLLVEDVTTWYNNKRFYISTNNPTEAYEVAYIADYYFAPNETPVAVPRRTGDTVVQSIDDLVPTTGGEYNWTNSINVSKNEGFLTQFDFAGGTGTSFENGTSVVLTAPTPFNNSKLDTGGYIQVAIEQSTNNIIYEIVFVRKNDDVIGNYHGSMATTNGTIWIGEETKRFYITTNTTKHTFKSTSLPHTYAGSVITTPGFVNVGDADYKIYTSDFTNIVPGRKFDMLGGTVTTVNNFIIALTHQELHSLNRLYQLETMEDIKSTGIRLTQNSLIMPLASPTIYVPSRVFKIPMRFRRVLRRITQMSGL